MEFAGDSLKICPWVSMMTFAVDETSVSGYLYHRLLGHQALHPPFTTLGQTPRFKSRHMSKMSSKTGGIPRGSPLSGGAICPHVVSRVVSLVYFAVDETFFSGYLYHRLLGHEVSSPTVEASQLEATQGQIDDSLVNSRTNDTRIGWHLWEIHLRFAPGLA